MRSCERPRKRSASEALPSSVSNRYSLSIRTHGNSCRRRASSSLRLVSSFSALSSSSRAASHSARDTTLGRFIWFFSVLVSILFSFCSITINQYLITNNQRLAPGSDLILLIAHFFHPVGAL